jgi:Ca-activated chloride channel family protein
VVCRSICVWAGMASALVLSVHAQERESVPITVDVQLVVLHATVTNGKGAPVSGLQQKDFRVYEDGTPQTIQLFQREDAPVAIGLLVDDSSSMRRKRGEVAAAADAFARASNPGDEMFG